MLGKHEFKIVVNEKFDHIIALTIFTILTLVSLHTLLPNIFDEIIGIPYDSYQHLWHLWWVNYAITHLHTNPFYSHYIYYPDGHELYSTPLMILMGIITIPFQAAFGLIFSYNLVLIAGFILGAYGIFLLVRQITKDTFAAILGGLIFAFSPFHFGEAFGGHLSLASIEGLSFFVYFLFRTREKNSKYSPFFAGLFLIIIAFASDLYYAFYAMIFLLIFTCYFICKDRSINKSFIIKILIVITIFSIPTIAVFFPVFVHPPDFIRAPLSDRVNFSADVTSYFLPGEYNQIFKINYRPLASSIEGSAYIGYTVLALIIYAVIKLRKESMFWLITLLIFFVLSLGPYLHISNESSTSIPLPYLLFSEITIFDIFRTPARLIIMVTLALSVISALSFNKLTNSFGLSKGIKIKFLLFCVLTTLIMIEYNALPVPLMDVSVPKIYSDMKSMQNDFSVLDFPAGYDLLYSWPNGQYMYYGTESEKPIITGYLSRTDTRAINEKIEIPILNYAEALAMNKTELDYRLPFFSSDSLSTNVCALKVFNTKYIILHKSFYSNTTLSELSKRLLPFTDQVYDDNAVSAFKVKTNDGDCFYAYGESGWYNTGRWGNSTVRFDDGKGIVKIISTDTQKIQMSFIAAHFYNEDDLLIYVNGKLIKTTQLSTPGFEGGKGFLPVELDGVQLNKGYNEIEFISSKGCTIPSSVNFNADSRCIGTEYQNFDTKIER